MGLLSAAVLAVLLASAAVAQDAPPTNHTPAPSPHLPKPLPTPPRVTPEIEKLMVKVEAEAAVAAAAAKPRLLALLAEPDFTTALHGCCPELEAMTPAERLDWFDAESAAAEMVGP